MTGRRNRAQTPSRFLPPRPSLPLAFLYGSKNWLAKIFSLSEQPWNSVRTSLVPLSICLCEVRDCSFGFLEAAQAKESWGGGGENTDLSRRESRYLDCGAKRSKTNLWLLWDGPLPRKSNCITNRKVKFKMFAVLFVYGNFLLARDGSS